MEENDENFQDSMQYLDDLITEDKLEEALEFTRKQLSQFSDGMGYIRFKIYESHLLSYLGSIDECIVAAESAVNEAKRIGHALFEVKGMIEIIYGKWQLGDLEEAYEVIQEAEAVLATLDLGDERVLITQADVFNSKGIIADNLGNIQEALKAFEESLAIRNKLNQPYEIGVSLNNIALVLQAMGQFDRAMKYLHQSLEIKRQLGNKLDVANTLSNIGTNYRRQGDLEKALEYIEQSLVIYRDLDTLSDLSNSLLNKVLFSTARKDLTTATNALEELEQAIERAPDRMTPIIQLNRDFARATLAKEKRDFIAAKGIFQQIIEGELMDHSLYILAVENMVDIELAEIEDDTNVDYTKIEELIEILVDIAKNQQLFPLHVASMVFMAKLQRVQDNPEKAREILFQALTIANKHEYMDLINDIDREIEILDSEVVEENDFDHYIGIIKRISREQ